MNEGMKEECEYKKQFKYMCYMYLAYVYCKFELEKIFKNIFIPLDSIVAYSQYCVAPVKLRGVLPKPNVMAFALCSMTLTLTLVVMRLIDYRMLQPGFEPSVCETNILPLR